MDRPGPPSHTNLDAKKIFQSKEKISYTFRKKTIFQMKKVLRPACCTNITHSTKQVSTQKNFFQLKKKFLTLSQKPFPSNKKTFRACLKEPIFYLRKIISFTKKKKKSQCQRKNFLYFPEKNPRAHPEKPNFPNENNFL